CVAFKRAPSDEPGAGRRCFFCDVPRAFTNSVTRPRRVSTVRQFSGLTETNGLSPSGPFSCGWPLGFLSFNDTYSFARCCAGMLELAFMRKRPGISTAFDCLDQVDYRLHKAPW